MSHANAILTPRGRLRLARCVVDEGWPLRRAAERFQVSVPTAARWAHAIANTARKGCTTAPAGPHSSPRRTATRTERRIIAVRVNRRWGPARIGYLLGIHPSTVHRVLSRYRLARLAWLDRATGQGNPPLRTREARGPGPRRHQETRPDPGRRRTPRPWQGRRAAEQDRDPVQPQARLPLLHNAVDDHSRLAYTEILTDETKETAAAFWERANAYFQSHGITVQRVLTDNGYCYRSHAFNEALGPDIKHKRTRPYRPQTNGKVERFNRTMLEEWAYARPYASEAERVAAFPDWLHDYNHHRGHTSLKGQPPASRVTNLSGQYI